jgi:Bacterial tandem repeat domain 1
MSGLVLMSALVALSPSAGPPTHPAWVVDVGLTSAQLSKRVEALRANGYQPTCINAYNSALDNRFALVSLKAKGPKWQMDWGKTPDQFLRRTRKLSDDGYTAVCVSGCNNIGAERLADLWLSGSSSTREISRGLDAAALIREAKRMRGRGYRPVWISSYMVDTFTTYAIIWEKSTDDWELKFAMSAASLQDSLDDLSARGYRPLCISGYAAHTAVRYCAVWQKRKGPAWLVSYGQSQDAFLTNARTMALRGYRPIAVSGYNTLEGDRFASVWEKE